MIDEETYRLLREHGGFNNAVDNAAAVQMPRLVERYLQGELDSDARTAIERAYWDMRNAFDMELAKMLTGAD